MSAELILQFKASLERFLDRWPEHMDAAGYLQHTTAKRQDCADAFLGVLAPLWELLQQDHPPAFARLVRGDRSFAEFMIKEARRHRFRGVTAEMFLGCFKTFVHSLEDILAELPGSAQEKLKASLALRQYCDAVECVYVGDWATLTQKEALQSLDETNRRLTLEKNKYENILAAASDLILVTDQDGCIVEANAAAQRLFPSEGLAGEPFWKALGLEGRDLQEALTYYPLHQAHEVSLLEGAAVFDLRISPLSHISLASEGYMLFLSNISCVVNQRESLAARLHERTVALQDSERLFGSLFRSAGDGILLVNTDLKIVAANLRAGEIFGVDPEALVDRDCRLLTNPGEQSALDQVIRGLDEDQIWVGELMGRQEEGRLFPMEVTINRVDLEEGSLFHVLARDITQQKAMEENLRQEKAQMEEMNVTLRNVMKAIDRDKKEMETAIAQKIENFLLPALDKVRKEPSAGIRQTYLDLIQGQLVGLTNGFSRQLDERFLKLTRTEISVCQYIQAGYSNKDIAGALNLSGETVQTHRRNIRKKLGLQGKSVNLFTFLSRNHQGQPDRV